MEVLHFFDYKSPYAYLAQEDTYALGEQFGVEVGFRPLTLHIPSFLGAAELDAQGNDLVRTRNEHQWRRVRYSYMDCRREANHRGLVIRGPRKIFDSRLAHTGFLYAQAQGNFRPYHDRVFEQFWKRELDIEDAQAIVRTLEETGFDAGGFPEFAAGPGAARLRALQADAEERGVFGVPSYLVDGELFWGAERLDRVRERLANR